MRSRDLRDLDLRVTALAKPSSNYTDKLQTRPLVREGASQEENCKCLKVFSMKVKENLVVGPKWWPDTRTDWPTDSRS
jgi:hypothetical protein